MELYDETVYSVYDFIECINSNYFPYSLRLSGETEWRIAAEYLPDGNTKTMVKAVVLKKLDNDKASAIKILKESFDKDPEYTPYQLFNCFDNENYTSPEESQKIYEKMSKYHDIKFKVQIRPETMKDIVGDKFVPGCVFYDEIKQIYKESENQFNQYTDSFKKVINSKTSEELLANLSAFITSIKNDTHNILHSESLWERYVQIYELIGEKPDLYSEGLLGFLEWRLNIEPYDYYMKNHMDEDNHPSTLPLIKLVMSRKIANDEILHFLYCLSDKENLDETRTENLILYSKIFEIQGFPKAARKYYELAEKRDDFGKAIKLFE